MKTGRKLFNHCFQMVKTRFMNKLITRQILEKLSKILNVNQKMELKIQFVRLINKHGKLHTTRDAMLLTQLFIDR